MSDGGVDWSALPHDEQRFVGTSFGYAYEEKRAQAFARDDLELMQNYYSRRGAHFAGLTQIIEFGTELTRGSDWLAQCGPLTIADVNPSEIYATEVRLESTLASEAKFVILQNTRDISVLPMCSFLYSILSLRYTPAAVLANILGILLARVTPGGLALLRVPTQHKHYQFMLPGVQQLAELNVIPQWRLFELLDSNGFSLVLVQEERLLQGADILYHMILAQRRE